MAWGAARRVVPGMQVAVAQGTQVAQCTAFEAGVVAAQCIAASVARTAALRVVENAVAAVRHAEVAAVMAVARKVARTVAVLAVAAVRHTEVAAPRSPLVAPVAWGEARLPLVAPVALVEPH